MHIDIEQIGELAREGVFIYDLNKQSFRYINSAFAKLFKASKEDLLLEPGLMLPMIKTEDDYYLRHCFSILKEKKSVNSVEFRLQLDNGAIKHLSCDAYLLQQSTAIAGFVRDVTMDKEHENYIVDYGAQKDTLLDMLSHNLAGPLALSKDIIHWMQQSQKTKDPEEINSHLHMIQDNTQHCLDIVNDFLKEEHLESERIYIKKTRFDVLDRIVNTVDKMIATNKSKKFQLLTDLENLNITTDSVKFFQIIHNLVSNSVKFTPVNGQIDVIVEEEEKVFIVRVRDNGIGIPVHLHSKVFERRSAARRGGLNNELSTGIGLSIVKTLVGLLGGKIWFESEENKGSTFSLEFPKD